MSPRSAEANQQRREVSREKILDAALALFSGHGFEATSMAAIAREAGVAHGLVAYYFGSKERVLAEVVSRRMTAAFSAVTQLRELPPQQALGAVIDATLSDAVAHRGTNGLLLSLMTRPGMREFFRGVESSAESVLAEAEDAIRALFAALGSVDPAIDEVLLRSVLEGITFKLVVYGDSYPVEPIRRRVYALFGLPAPEPLFATPPGEVRLRA